MRFLTAVLRCMLWCMLLTSPGWTGRAQAQEPPAQVVFVCEHGNVKSLIAATLFNQAAQRRGLSVRATSRGINPEPGVPDKIISALQNEGADVRGFKPRKLTMNEVSSAQRVIAIGVDLSPFRAGETDTMAYWSDIPPASIDYAASRAALLRHIDLMLAEWQARDID